MLEICFMINAIIPIVYVVIYWDIVKDRARRKQIPASYKLLIIGVIISIIALLINIVSIFYY